MSDFDRLRNSVTFGAFGGVSVGILLFFTPAKASTTWVIGASVGFLAATQLIVDSSQRIHKDKLKTIESEVKKLSDNLSIERNFASVKVKELADKDKQLSSQEIAITQLKQESAQFLGWINKLREEISQKAHQIKSLQTANGEVSTEILRDSFHEFNSSLTALIASLSKRYPNLTKDWDVLSYELDKYIKLFHTKVSVVISQTNAQDLIEMSLAMQHEIISIGAMLKVKAYKSVVTYLSNQLQNVIPVTQHEQLIEELNATWLTKNQSVISTYQKNFQAIKQEFGEFADNVTTAYEEDFKSVIDEGMSQADQIEALQLEIVRLQQLLKEASKPHRFPSAVEQSRIGNSIIDYYYRAGICLDAIDWDSSDTGYKLLFHVGRNGDRYISESLLNENDAPQKIKELAACLNTPQFFHNVRGGHMVLEIQTKHSQKKSSAKDDIDKIWIPAHKFETYVKRWERVRITAGSTGGKSPTAKNLALAIMSARKGQGEIKLYDPQHGSKKDFWEMPKAGTSHEDNIEGIGELCQLLDDRTKAKGNHPFVLYIFDEIDSTIASNRSDAYAVKDKVVYSLSQGSHQDIGVIYIGQSADANTIPGMSHSQWNNAIQLHIGSNAGIWLDKAKTITTEDKNRLLDQYRKIQEYCDRMNEELGLDIFTDASAYRFALTVPLTGLPKFIQLPDFDSYDYYKVMDSSHNQIEKLPIKSTVLEVNIQCPHCESPNVIKDGKNRKTFKQLYRCKDCDISPKQWSANSN